MKVFSLQRFSFPNHPESSVMGVSDVSPWAPCYTDYKGVVSNQVQTQRSVSTVHTSTVIIRWIHFPVSRNEVTKQRHLIPLGDPCTGSKDLLQSPLAWRNPRGLATSTEYPGCWGWINPRPYWSTYRGCKDPVGLDTTNKSCAQHIFSWLSSFI